MDTQALASYFDYLDALRQSGVSNMFGAASYLVENEGLERREAQLVLTLWMRTFNLVQSPYDRAVMALQAEPAKGAA